MPSFFDLQRYAATGIAAPDMTYYDRMRASTLMGGAVKTLTGITPLSFKADGTPLISWSMKGNGQQTGTPTPDNPVMPEFVGVKTGNLLDYKYLYSDNTIRVSDYFNYYALTSLKPNTDYTLLTNAPSSASNPNETTLMIGNSNTMSTQSNGVYSQIAKTVTTDSEGKIYIAIRKKRGTSEGSIILVQESDFMNGTYTVMLNEGSTALPYEPFGYKIPITCAGQTVPVYLGQTQTVRRIKKLVLTGNETASSITQTIDGNNYCVAYKYSDLGMTDILDYDEYTYRCRYPVFVSSHFTMKSIAGLPLPNEYNNIQTGQIGGNTWKPVGVKPETFNRFVIFCVSGITTINDFKSYLAQQYAAGTPVTVWYVLATPETATVNEPLAKIGDYADELSSTDAGVTIPTVKGSNTLTVETDLQPYEMTITYRGEYTN